MTHSKRDKIKAFLVILPSIIAILIFVYFFIFWNIRVSFSKWDGIIPNFAFAGLKNYIEIFKSERFIIDLQNTFYFTLFFLLITIVGGIILALLIDTKVKGEGFFRTIFMFPMALSFIVTGIVWRWIFNPTIGVNVLLHKIGFKSFNFGWYTLSSSIAYFHYALIPVFLAASWQLMGYTMAMYLAGLRGIPDELREAAKVDGGSGWQILRYIILPMLKPITLSAMIVLGHISLKIFDLVYAMTGKGPGFSTDVPGIFMFETTFRGNHYAKGAVIATVMLILVAIVIIPYLYYNFKKEK